jgi:hypothetical protein
MTDLLEFLGLQQRRDLLETDSSSSSPITAFRAALVNQAVLKTREGRGTPAMQIL